MAKPKLILNVVFDPPGLEDEVLEQLAQEARQDLETALNRRLGNPPAPPFTVTARTNG